MNIAPFWSTVGGVLGIPQIVLTLLHLGGSAYYIACSVLLHLLQPMSPFSIGLNFHIVIYWKGSHNLICVSTAQKSKGTAEKKTKRKSDRFDEEIASDSDEGWVDLYSRHIKVKLMVSLFTSVGLLRARLRGRGCIVIILIQMRKRQLLRKGWGWQRTIFPSWNKKVLLKCQALYYSLH